MTTAVKPNPASALSKKQQVEEMFDNISPRYDFLNHLLSFGIDKGWRKKVRKTIGALGHTNILDVATGTGDMAIELCKLGDVQVTGVDISKGMLSLASKKITQLNLGDKLRVMQADSESLPFSDNTFDAVTVCFGVRNYENLEMGLQEMRRVLKPGGHLAVLEFSKPKNKVVRIFYWFYFKNILPFFGRLFSGSNNAYTYLPASVQAFPEGDAFCTIAKSCGFISTNYKPLTFGIATLYTCGK